MSSWVGLFVQEQEMVLAEALSNYVAICVVNDLVSLHSLITLEIRKKR